MQNLSDVLADAQNGEAMAQLGRKYGLSPQQTQAAVAALLPAISMGLKRSTATPEGLGNLFALMGAQPDLYAMYDDPQAAFSREGQVAGNAVLARMFGSPDASRAIASQAQQMSGIGSAILKKLLPVIAGILISGLARSGSGKAAPSAPQTSPEQGGGLADILRQIFGQGGEEPSGPSGRTSSPIPPITDILGPERGTAGSAKSNKPSVPANQPTSVPTDSGGQASPSGDVLAQLMRELAKAIQDGRLKPVVVGPIEIGIPGQAGPAGPAGQTQSPTGDIFGQILRDLLGGKGGQMKPATLTNGTGSAVFGDRFEAGQEIEQDHLESLQELFDRFSATGR